jgi:C4-dicarboxylate-binding protein DctP
MLKKVPVLTSIVILFVILTSTLALADGLITIKFSHVVAENSPKGKMAMRFKNLVAERLDGKVKVEVYPNSQLFGDKDEIEAMLHGDVQIIAPALSKLERYTKQLQVFDLPFLFRDIAAVDKFMKGIKGRALLDSMESKGMMGFGYLHNGLKQFTCSSPMRLPADANGLKFRIMASDVLVAQFHAVYATPIQKAFSDVSTLLQTRAIDGQENTFSNIYSQKYYEFQQYITESNHGVLGYMVVTSIEFWRSLPEPIRIEVKKALVEAIIYGNSIALAQDLEDRQKIIESNRSEVITLTEAERSQWIEVMRPVWAKFEEEIGKDLVDEAYQSNM